MYEIKSNVGNKRKLIKLTKQKMFNILCDMCVVETKAAKYISIQFKWM